MSAEIQWRGTETGVTLYATIRSKTGTQWNTAGTPNFEAVTAANWADYDIALAESSGNYFYVGTFPAITGNMVAGWYWVDIYKKAGGTVAITDVLQGTIVGYWNGTSLLPWASDATEIKTQAITCAAPVTMGAYVGNATAALSVSAAGRVDVGLWLGTACATPSVAGVPEVDLTHVNGVAASGSSSVDANVVSVSGDTTAADNLELAYDGTGYAGGTIKPKVDLDTIKTQTVAATGTVTFNANVGAAAAPGAANGMLIGGSNAATTFASLSVTGQLDAGNLLVDGTTVLTGNVTHGGYTTYTEAFVLTDIVSAGSVGLYLATADSAAQKLNTAMVKDGSVYDFTAASLDRVVSPTADAVLGRSINTYTDPPTTVNDFLSAIKAGTIGNSLTLGVAGAGLTAVPWNTAWEAKVQSECDDAITANTLVKRIMPALAGTVTGAGTGTEVFVYGGVTMTVTVDVNGNRSVVAWS
jgi:hypothetical protein